MRYHVMPVPNTAPLAVHGGMLWQVIDTRMDNRVIAYFREEEDAQIFVKAL